LELPISHPSEEIQGDVGDKALQEGEHVFEVEEPQIPRKFEAQEKEVPTFEDPYVPPTELPQDKDVQATFIEEVEETAVSKENSNDPIPVLAKLPQDGDVEALFEVPTEKKVECEEMEPSFQEVARSLELPITYPIQETQGDVGVETLQEGEHVSEVEESQIEAAITKPQIPDKFEVQEKKARTFQEPYVPSIQQLHDQDVEPTTVEEQEKTPIIKEDMSPPIPTLHELPQDGDVEAPLEVATRKEVRRKEVEPTFEVVPRSLELPISHLVEESQGHVGVQALQEDERVSEVEEPRIPCKFAPEEKEAPTIEEPHVGSPPLPQDKDVQPTSIEEAKETPIIKEDTSDPIQALDELPQDGDVEAPFQVPMEKKVEPKEVEQSFQEVPRSLELPISRPIEKPQGDVGVKALMEGEHVFEVEEPQIEGPVEEPQILHRFQAQQKEAPTLEEQDVPFMEEPQDQDVKPTSIEEQEETRVVKVDTSAPIQALHELPQDHDVEAPFEVATRKKVKPQEVKPSFEEVPRSLELLISHPIEESQGKVGVEALQEGECVSEVEEPQILCNFEVEKKEAPTLEKPYFSSIELPQDKDVQPTSIEEEEGIPIIKEDTSDPIPTLHELPKDVDVEAPFDVPTEKKVEPKEMEPSFEEVQRSLELPINHPIEETQGDVGVEALHEGEHVYEVKEPQIPRKFEAKEKEAPTLEEPYVPSIELPQDKDVQPTSIEEEEETPIFKEDMSDPIQSLGELPQYGNIEAPFEVPTKKKVEPEEVEPSFQEVSTSLELLVNHPIEDTQGDVGVEALQEVEHVSKVEEPQIEAPVMEPEIPHKFEAEDKEASTLEEPYVPPIEQLQDEDVKPTSIKEQEDTSAPIQALHELLGVGDVEASFEVATKKQVEQEEMEPSFEDVPRR
jgi:hypothetical protein